MKLYLIIITTLFFSNLLRAEEVFFPGPFHWKNSYTVYGDVFASEFTRTVFAPSNVPPDKQELFQSVTHYQPFQIIKQKTTLNGKPMFDVTYEVREFGLRYTPENLYQKPPRSHLIIAGDSNTFGYGVNVEDTLPVLLAKSMPYTRPYNFSESGRSPSATLAFMEFFRWDTLIAEPEGLFIYNYYDFLLDRVIGEKYFLKMAPGENVWYDLDDNGDAVFKGFFSERFLSKVFKFVAMNAWLDKLLPVLPRYRYHHTEILAKVFQKMQKIYQSRFPRGRFMVAINYISFQVKPERLEDLKLELKKLKIEFIVIDDLKAQSPEYRFKDAHLNVPGHHKEAEIFLKVLSLNKVIR